MKKLLLFALLLSTVYFSKAQETAPPKLWTEADRKYTLDNMKRSRDELVKETEDLTPAQWAFHESSDRWSIGEIVEHLALWELIWNREISIGTRNTPQPELNASSKPDSYYNEFIMEDTKHNASDITKPTGFIEGKNNLTFFLRNHAVNLTFIETSKVDMRAHFEFTNTPNPRNMHQVLIFQWGHVDRHLRQIRKVKVHPNYPK
ncbi:DinB family protein [Runella sp.]|uniref:DinB family protein n=1 Tax=Runella sp. TaxID=1960881 RepID=UPI003D0FE27B